MAAAGLACAGRVQAASMARAPRRPGGLGARRRPGLRLPTPAARHRLPVVGQRGGRPRPRAPGPRPPRPRASLEASLGQASAAAAAGGASWRLSRPAASYPEPRAPGRAPAPELGGLESQPMHLEVTVSRIFYLDRASLSEPIRPCGAPDVTSLRQHHAGGWPVN